MGGLGGAGDSKPSFDDLEPATDSDDEELPDLVWLKRHFEQNQACVMKADIDLCWMDQPVIWLLFQSNLHTISEETFSLCVGEVTIIFRTMFTPFYIHSSSDIARPNLLPNG